MNFFYFRPILIFLMIITIQFSLVFNYDFSSYNKLSGDEGDYYNDATYFLENNMIKKADAAHYERIMDRKVGYFSDYRLPGYSLFLSLFLQDEEIKSNRKKVSIIHFLLISFLIFIIFIILNKKLENNILRILSAILFSIQPWAFNYIVSMCPESIFLFFINCSVLLMGVFLYSNEKIISLSSLILANLFFCTSIFMRPDAIVSYPLILIFALCLKFYEKSKNIIPETFICLFFIFASISLSKKYTNYFDKSNGVFVKFSHATPGLYDWSHTLVVNERVRNGIVWGITKKNYRNSFDIIKKSMAANDDEKYYINEALNIMNTNGGKYNFQVDSIFQNLTKKRINNNFFSYYLIPRVHSTVHLLINKETNQQLKYFLSNKNKYFRIFSKGFYFVLKLGMIITVLVFSFPISKNISFNKRDYLEYLYLMFLILFISRWIFFGMVYVSSEHRYIVPLMPGLIFMFMYSVIFIKDKYFKNEKNI